MSEPTEQQDAGRGRFQSHGGDQHALAAAEAPKFEYVQWTKEPHLRRLYGLTIILMVASATTGYDGMLVNTSQQMDLWEKYFSPQVKDANLLGILINMFSIGSIVSFFITPYIADNYGRKASISIGCVFMIIGGCLTAFTNGFEMYLAGRFVLGFGNSLSQMASPMLLTEICHPQHRGPVTAIYNCLWNLGALVVSCIGWGTIQVQNDWSWRSITFIQIVPSVIQIVGIWWVPESPRYLLSKDRAEEALQVLAKHHGGGDVNNLTVQFEWREIRDTLHLQKTADRSSRYIDFFRTKGNRWRLSILISIGIISQYSGNALFSNYMNAIYEGAGITDQNQKLGLSTGQTILNLAITIMAALSVDKFGRRPLFLISTAGMVGSFVCWTICGVIYENALTYPKGEKKDGTPLDPIPGNTASGYAQLVFIWIFGIFYDIGFSGLLVAYALEILPFSLRAKGMMIMNMTVQAILAIGNQTNKLAWDTLPNHWNFMLFYTLWDTLEFIFVYFFYVETKGPTLEEIARIFDGDSAVAHLDIHQVEKELHGAEHEEDVTDRHMRSEKTAV